METYKQQKDRQQEEYNEFSKDAMFFAFSNKQFYEGLERFNIPQDDYADKILRTIGGGFILKSKDDEYGKLNERHRQEFEDAIKADTTGDGFIYEMFKYEMNNHEYCITLDIEPTLDCLGLSAERVNEDERMKKAIKRCHHEIMKWAREN